MIIDVINFNYNILKKKAKEISGVDIVIVTNKQMEEISGLKNSFEAAYGHIDNVIYVRRNLFKKKLSRLIYILSHEIGHSIDKKNNQRLFNLFQKSSKELFNKLVENEYDIKIPKKLARNVLLAEMSACLNGENFIKQLDVKIDVNDIIEYRAELINAYIELTGYI